MKKSGFAKARYKVENVLRSEAEIEISRKQEREIEKCENEIQMQKIKKVAKNFYKYKMKNEKSFCKRKKIKFFACKKF